jgi:hypothetical protein
MKTLKTLSVILLTLTIIGINGMYAKANRLQNQPQINGSIKYQVHVHSSDDISWPLLNIFVVMTDQNGRQVAPAQLFTIGTWTYNFTEAGPVTGTRIARLTTPSEGGQYLSLFPYPDSKTGTFLNGKTYPFDLYPYVPGPVPIPKGKYITNY